MAKVYICDIGKHSFNENLIEKYKIKTDSYKYILSYDGIFKIHNNDILKLKPVDLKFEKKKINNIDLLFDYSNLNTKKCNNIPISDNLINIEKSIYELRKNSNLRLHIEKLHNNKLYDIYFVANNKLDEYNLNEELNTFLTMLN
jgi:hypothetical protein